MLVRLANRNSRPNGAISSRRDEKVNINRTLAQPAIILFMKINTGDVWEDSVAADQRDANRKTSQ